MTQQEPGNDYPLSEVPLHARKGLASTAMVLLGFTFFTATMFAGGKLGVAFNFIDMLGVVALGNLLLGIYAAGLGYIAFKSGLNSVLMGRFCFGEVGSKLSDLILGFTQIGWYAWGTATAAVVLGKYFELSQGSVLGLMVVFRLAVLRHGLRGVSRVGDPVLHRSAGHGHFADSVDVGRYRESRRAGWPAGGGANR